MGEYRVMWVQRYCEASELAVKFIREPENARGPKRRC